jgi:hypothetical protein
VNFRELLAARGLVRPSGKAPIMPVHALPLPLVHAPDPHVVAAAAVPGGGSSGSSPAVVWVAATAAAALGVALLGFAIPQLRHWRL